MNVICPREVDCIVVTGKTECALRNLNCHVSAVNCVFNVSNLLGFITVSKLFKNECLFACSGLIYNVFERFPTLIILVGVDVKIHPEAICVRSDIVRTFNVEVYVLAISCNLRTDNIVSTGCFSIDICISFNVGICLLIVGVSVITFSVSVLSIADIRCVVRSYVTPLLISCAHIDCLVFAGSRNGIYALVLTDVVSRKVVIVVLECALCGFKVTAVFVDKLVSKRIFYAHPKVRLTPSVPFVPTCNKYYLRVNLESVIKLLLEEVTVKCSVLTFNLISVRILGRVRTSHYVFTVHSSKLMSYVVVVAGNTNCNLLYLTSCIVALRCRITYLRVCREPTPSVEEGLIYCFEIILRLSRSPSEQVLNGTAYLTAGSHEHGLAVPVKPEALIFICAVNICVNILRAAFKLVICRRST